MTKNNLNLPLRKEKFKNLNKTSLSKKKIKIKKNNKKNLRRMMKNKNLTKKVKSGTQVWIINRSKMNKNLNQGMEDQVEVNLKLNNKKTTKSLTKVTGNNKLIMEIKNKRKNLHTKEGEKMMMMKKN